jgi:hypothetical protein
VGTGRTTRLNILLAEAVVPVQSEVLIQAQFLALAGLEYLRQ